LKDSEYSSRFDELLGLLKAIDNELKTSEQIERALSELDKQIKADQDAILQIQSKLDLLYASGRFGAYNSLVDQHNSLVRRYKRNIAAFNNKVGMANRTKARLEQEIAKAGKAFNDCLDQKMIFRWFSNNEASSAEGLMR
jgi:chromosome segregation ATPase